MNKSIPSSIDDTLKLLTKEDLRPATADFVAFELAVFMIFIPALMVFVAVPFTADWLISAIPLSLLYILAVSGLSLQLVNDLPGALLQIRRALRPDALMKPSISAWVTAPTFLARNRPSGAYTR